MVRLCAKKNNLKEGIMMGWDDFNAHSGFSVGTGDRVRL